MKLSKSFVAEIRELITSARTTVARGVDLVQVHTNFEIGRRIVQQEQKGKSRAAYGQEVIKALAEQLTAEFGKGFATTNLEYMRRFFLLYQGRQQISQSVTGRSGRPQKSQTLTGTSGLPDAGHGGAGRQRFALSWTHYVLLMGIANPNERSFYEIESAQQDWTVRELKRQFDSSLYERLALSRDKKGVRKLARDGQTIAHPEDLLKEPLVLEFLGLDEQARYSETDLESAIISQIERFLLEMGKGFLFEARQKRFTFDGDHYFVDLVFYNRLLRCYILLDLKLGKLTHQDLGQMQMYVNHYDRSVKQEYENPTIGIVLCKKKHSAMVEITLPKGANIHTREYQLYLPSKDELRRKLLEWTKCERTR
jgi:predicted nuclease of restriction endonuclease-like (RecB) superfamily